MNTSALITTIAELLATAGVGAWRPAGPAYTATETAITYRALPAAPDRAIAVAAYDNVDDPVTGTAVRFVQLRVRGRAERIADADDLADFAFGVLHDRHQPAPGIARILRTSTVPLGADGNARQERSDNYQIILDNPEALA